MEEKLKRRMTQKSLVLGIYVGEKDSVRPGLNIWYRGRYIWPMGVKRVKVIVAQQELPLTTDRRAQQPVERIM